MYIVHSARGRVGRTESNLAAPQRGSEKGKAENSIEHTKEYIKCKGFIQRNTYKGILCRKRYSKGIHTKEYIQRNTYKGFLCRKRYSKMQGKQPTTSANHLKGYRTEVLRKISAVKVRESGKNMFK